MRGVGGYIVIAGPDRPGFDVRQLDTVATFPRPEWLTPSTDTANAASLADVAAFVATHTANGTPSKLDGIRHHLDEWKPGGERLNGKRHKAARHDTAVDVACWIAREAADGHFAAADGFDVLRGWWRHVMDDADRRDGRELPSVIAWAVGQSDTEGRRPPSVDPETGEIADPLDDDFWTSRGHLDHIRQAAYSRCRSAQAVLGVVLARVAMLTPPGTGIPAIVGSRATFDLLVDLIGPSGAGKSSANDVARELLPTERVDVKDGFLLGSGEGIAEAFLGPPEKVKGDDGKDRTIRRQETTAVLAVADEGQVLLELGTRKGSLLLPQLRTAWSGHTLGQENAKAETWRRIEQGRYRFAAVLSLQPKYAAKLIDDTAGMAQRLLWFNAVDPAIPDEPPPWPGPLDWTPPLAVNFGGDLTADPAIVAEIRKRALARARGIEVADELDAHADLLRLKVAGLLTELDRRRNIDADDWRLAGRILDASNRVRTDVKAYAAIEARRHEDASHARAARREVTVRDTVADRSTKAMARAMARKVGRVADSEHRSVKRGECNRAVSGADRGAGSFDAAIDYAIDQGWIVADGDGFTLGESRPA